MTQSIKTQIYPGTGGKVITPDTPFNLCRAVNCATAGLATVTFQDGSVAPVYLVQGWNPCSITNVASADLAAADLVAIY